MKASITIEAPTAATTWLVGVPQTIRWTASGIDESKKGQLVIFLSLNGTANKETAVAITTAPLLAANGIQEYPFTPQAGHVTSTALVFVGYFEVNAFLAETWSNQFTIAAGGETIPPTIGAFTATTSAVVGSPITLTASDVSDFGGSGLSRISWRRGLSAGALTEIGSTPLGGNGPETVAFNDSPPGLGSYFYGARVVDGAGNTTPSDTVNSTIVGSASVIISLGGNLAFGPVEVGSATGRTLTISNTGTSPLTVTSVNYPTGFSGAFAGSIPAGGSTTVTVTFAPASLIAYGGTITVVGNQTAGTNTIAVSGSGTATATRIISVTGNLAFGSVPVGTTTSKTLTISNTGASALTVSSITYPTGFTGAFSGSIPAGGSQNVTVTFAPVSTIAYGGTITVLGNQTSGTNTIATSGTGIGATRIISVTTSGSIMAFSTVPIRGTATKVLTIGNTGNAPLTVSGITYPIAGFSHDPFNPVIPSQGFVNVTVRFSPQAATNYAGTITINSNQTGGTNTIGFSGGGSQLLPPGTFLLEDFEGGSAWFGQTPWAVTTESAHSGSRAWSDSPNAAYAANVNLSFYAPTLDLSTAVEPVLEFWQRHDIGLGIDVAAVWVWDGTTWTQLLTMTGTDLTWKKTTLDLSAFAGLTSVQVVFQIYSDATGAGDGFYVDDVVVKNSKSRLVDLNADRRGDAFIYKQSTGEWARMVTAAAGGFTGINGGFAAGFSAQPGRFDRGLQTDLFLFSQTSGQWFKMLTNDAGFTVQASGAWWPGWQRHLLDLDGDGLTDVFLNDPVTGQWFKCISTPTGFTYYQGGWSPGWELYPMMLNADRRKDLFLFNRTTGQWAWALSEAGGAFSYPSWGSWATDWQFSPGDFSGDGLADLHLYRPSTGEYIVALNTGSGFVYVGGAWAPGLALSVLDIDGNGTADMFAHNKAAGVWIELVGNGFGNFTGVGSGSWSPGWDIYPTDFDEDGRTDLLLYNPTNGQYSQAWNLALGSFAFFGGGWNSGLTILVGSPFR